MRERGSSLISSLLTVAVAVSGGVLGALLYIRSQDAPLRVQVLDMRRLVESVASDATLDAAARRKRTEEIADSVAKLVNQQASQGVIVLDASAVLSAPPESYVAP